MYRQWVESDLEHHARDWWEEEGNEPGSFSWAIYLFAEWSGRYGRRVEYIKRGFGSSPLADQPGKQALMRWQRQRDRKETGKPDWGSELDQLIEMALQNAPHDIEVTAFDQPHNYGLSMRALWVQAKRLDYPDSQAWRYIVEWSRHRPAAWEAEDRRKKQGLAYMTAELGDFLARELRWDSTGDVNYPWGAEVDGARWQVGINDFPDDFMYSLVIDGQSAGGFHDWPENWQR
jgi:hypothetical protein